MTSIGGAGAPRPIPQPVESEAAGSTAAGAGAGGDGTTAERGHGGGGRFSAFVARTQGGGEGGGPNVEGAGHHRRFLRGDGVHGGGGFRGRGDGVRGDGVRGDAVRGNGVRGDGVRGDGVRGLHGGGGVLGGGGDFPRMHGGGRPHFVPRVEDGPPAGHIDVPHGGTGHLGGGAHVAAGGGAAIDDDAASVVMHTLSGGGAHPALLPGRSGGPGREVLGPGRDTGAQRPDGETHNVVVRETGLPGSAGHLATGRPSEPGRADALAPRELPGADEVFLSPPPRSSETSAAGVPLRPPVRQGDGAGWAGPRAGAALGGREPLAEGTRLESPEGHDLHQLGAMLSAPPGEGGEARRSRGWAQDPALPGGAPRPTGPSPQAAALLGSLRGGLADDPAAAARAILTAGPEAAGEALAALALEGPIDRMMATELLSMLPEDAQSTLIDHLEAALPPEERAAVLASMGVVDDGAPATGDAAGAEAGEWPGGTRATGAEGSDATAGATSATTAEGATADGATADGATAATTTEGTAEATASGEAKGSAGSEAAAGKAGAEAGKAGAGAAAGARAEAAGAKAKAGAEGSTDAAAAAAAAAGGKGAPAAGAGAAGAKGLAGKGEGEAGALGLTGAGAGAEAGLRAKVGAEGRIGLDGRGGAGGKGGDLSAEAEKLGAAGARGAPMSGSLASLKSAAAGGAEAKASTLSPQAAEVRQLLQGALAARAAGGADAATAVALGAAFGGLAKLLKGGREDACAVIDDCFAPKAAYVLHQHERRTGDAGGDGAREEADELIDAMRSLDFAGLKAVALDRAASRIAGLRLDLAASGDPAKAEELGRARTQAALLLASDPIGVARFGRESPETFPRTAARSVMGELLRASEAAATDALAASLAMLLRPATVGSGAHKAFAAGYWCGAGAGAAARIAQEESIIVGVAEAEAAGRALLQAAAAGRLLAQRLGPSPGGVADRDEALRMLDQERGALDGAVASAARGEGAFSEGAIEARRLGGVLKSALAAGFSLMDPDADQDLEGELLSGFRSAGA